MNWEQFDRGVFLVNVLGVIHNPKTGKILIGKRQNDKYLKRLFWCFPGGRPAYGKDLEFYLQHEIRIKTGLKIEIKKIIFAKTYPEKREFLSIYYLCQVASGRVKAGEKFTELKWVKPNEVKKYFTTSIHPYLREFLKTLL